MIVLCRWIRISTFVGDVRGNHNTTFVQTQLSHTKGSMHLYGRCSMEVVVCLFALRAMGVRDGRGIAWILHCEPKRLARTRGILEKHRQACSQSKKGSSLQSVEECEEGLSLKLVWKQEASYNSVWSWLTSALPAGFRDWASLEVAQSWQCLSSVAGRLSMQSQQCLHSVAFASVQVLEDKKANCHLSGNPGASCEGSTKGPPSPKQDICFHAYWEYFRSMGRQLQQHCGYSDRHCVGKGTCLQHQPCLCRAGASSDGQGLQRGSLSDPESGGPRRRRLGEGRAHVSVYLCCVSSFVLRYSPTQGQTMGWGGSPLKDRTEHPRFRDLGLAPLTHNILWETI